MAPTKKERYFWIAIGFLFLGCLAAFMLNLFKSEIKGSSEAERSKSKTIQKAIKKKEHKIYLPGKYTVNFVFDEEGYWFSHAMASDRDLINLIENEEVKKLKIKHSEITAETLARLKEEPLEDLFLFRPDIDKSYMPVIASFKNLKRLTLRDSSIIDDSLLEELIGPAGLEYISIRNNNKVGDASVQHIAKTFKNLREIDLRKVKKLTVSGIKALSSLDNLKAINLNNIELTTEMVEALAGFKKLERLDAVESHIDDTKLKLLRKTAIKELNIDQNLITAYSLRHTLNNMKLSKLSIRNCNELDDNDINWFKRKHRQIRLIDNLVDSNG